MLTWAEHAGASSGGARRESGLRAEPCLFAARTHVEAMDTAPAQPPPAPSDTLRARALRRVRLIAALSALTETLALLPGADAVVMAVQWLGLKGAVPAVLACLDALFEGRVPTAADLFAHGSWWGLVGTAFGPAAAPWVLTADGATDGAALLPPPFDGFDLPPAIADGTIAVAAHLVLRRVETAEGPSTPSVVVPGAVRT